MEGDHFVEESGENVRWETHKVVLVKAPVFGFGIAVSGGRDSPHFANGDPSIAISDVLKAGPAEGKLQINDRIVSVNGTSLVNVEHAEAIAVLRDCGNTVNLVVRRRVAVSASPESESPPLKVTLSKKNKKDDFGVVLGCRFYVKEIPGHTLAAQEGSIKEGDTVLKINNSPVENLSLVEARRLVEKTKDKLQLVVTKRRQDDNRHKRQNSLLKEEATVPPEAARNYDSLRRQMDKDDVNIYRPSVRSEEDVYKPSGLPQGAPPHSQYDGGRYGYEVDAPPRPPLPTGYDQGDGGHLGPPSPSQGYHSSEDPYPPRDGGYPGDHGYNSMPDRLHNHTGVPEEDDVFSRSYHEERYVGARKDIALEPRGVRFQKDAQMGLGLRLAGGNATGIFIASVQPGSAAEMQGLTEGDQILRANEKDITGLTREEAVNYLTSLTGLVTLTVQYKKEEFDRIMTSHEAGDSFYIRTHFNFEGSDPSEHSFSVGDIFHVKDTLFRGVGGCWLAIRIDSQHQEGKKGTLPNSALAEKIAASQQQGANDKEAFPNKGRGSLFKRKGARRAKSLGKDHWEEVIFSEEGAGLSTKFPAYERVVLREAGFVRPVVIFGAISDIARDRLLAEYSKFVSPQSDVTPEDEAKRTKSGIIRLGAIRDAIAQKKHCLLDLTPHHVDRLNFAGFCPVVLLLKADGKQAVKDVRARHSRPTKNPKKLLEHDERMEKLFPHIFTGSITHNSSDNWFPRLCEIIDKQQHMSIWMSEKKTQDDINDDFLFPMPNRLSYAAYPESDLDVSRPHDDHDLSPRNKKRLMRSSSDPSINTAEHIPGIPPYPAPPNYHTNRHASEELHSWHAPDLHHQHQHSPIRNAVPPGEDRYYPSYYADPPPQLQQPGSPHQQQHSPHSRANIDPYATLTPSERLRPRMPEDQYPSGDFRQPQQQGPGDHRYGSAEIYRPETSAYPPGSPMESPHTPHTPHSQPHHPEHRGHNDSSSHSSDSYSKYTSRPANKHDDSKLREKFGSLAVSSAGRERSPGSHDPYRFTRSTANPINKAAVDKAKISDLSAKYRKDEGGRGSRPSPGKAPLSPTEAPGKKKVPPPVPAKSLRAKEMAAMEVDDVKVRNYENSNRQYNYSDVNFGGGGPGSAAPGDRYGDGSQYLGSLPADLDHYPPPGDGGYGGRQQQQQHQEGYPSNQDQPYEWLSLRNGSGPPPRDLRQQRPLQEPYGQASDMGDRGHAFSNHVYMDQRELDRIRSGWSKELSQRGAGRESLQGYGGMVGQESPSQGYGGQPRTATSRPPSARDSSAPPTPSSHPRGQSAPPYSRSREGSRTDLHRTSSFGKDAYVTKEGNYVTKEGNYVTKEGNYVTQEGNYVTKEGNRVTKEGGSIVDLSRTSSFGPGGRYPAGKDGSSTTDLHRSGSLGQSGGSDYVTTRDGGGDAEERDPRSRNSSAAGAGSYVTKDGDALGDPHRHHHHHHRPASYVHGGVEGKDGGGNGSGGGSGVTFRRSLSLEPRNSWRWNPADSSSSSNNEVMLQRRSEGLSYKASSFENKDGSTNDITFRRSESFGYSFSHNQVERRSFAGQTSRSTTDALYYSSSSRSSDRGAGGLYSSTQDGGFGVPRSYYDRSWRDSGPASLGTSDLYGNDVDGYDVDGGPSSFDVTHLNYYRGVQGSSRPTTTTVGSRSSAGVARTPSFDRSAGGPSAYTGRDDHYVHHSRMYGDEDEQCSSVPTPHGHSHSTNPSSSMPDAGRSHDINMAATTTMSSSSYSNETYSSIPSSSRDAAENSSNYRRNNNNNTSAELSRSYTSDSSGVVPDKTASASRTREYRKTINDFSSVRVGSTIEEREFSAPTTPTKELKPILRTRDSSAPPPSRSGSGSKKSASMNDVRASRTFQGSAKDIIDVFNHQQHQQKESNLTTAAAMATTKVGSNSQQQLAGQHQASTGTSSSSRDPVIPTHAVPASSADEPGFTSTAITGSSDKDLLSTTKMAAADKEIHVSVPASARDVVRSSRFPSARSREASSSPQDAANTDTDASASSLVSARLASNSGIVSKVKDEVRSSTRSLGQDGGGGGGASERRRGSSLQDLRSDGSSHPSAFETYRKPETKTEVAATTTTTAAGTTSVAEKPRNGPDKRETVDGQQVVATARGLFDHTGGVLESKETGVSIVIPPGALPEGPPQEVYFKVCQDSSILPPLDKNKGETLLSPLVMCGPHGLQFRRPVELRLPHCASLNPESWSFALKSSDSPSGQPTQWNNVALAGMEGVAQGHVGKKCVSVLVDHF